MFVCWLYNFALKFIVCVYNFPCYYCTKYNKINNYIKMAAITREWWRRVVNAYEV